MVYLVVHLHHSYAQAAALQADIGQGVYVLSLASLFNRTSGWGIPAGLIILSLVPAAAGIVRLLQLANGAATPENARFFDAPTPVILHITAVLLFSLLGALQFAPHLRNACPRWHRWSGRIIVPSGLVAALTGLWMAHFYILPPTDGTALYITRLIVGVWMVFALCRGYVAIRQRDIGAHRDFMLRGYAIGMGAGTQVLTSLPYFILAGEPETAVRAGLMGAGWAINAAVAEVIICRRARASRYALA
ncbi:MAG: DUF2306 domain-containing protein [Rhizobiaceae bacterium]